MVEGALRLRVHLPGLYGGQEGASEVAMFERGRERGRERERERERGRDIVQWGVLGVLL